MITQAWFIYYSIDESDRWSFSPQAFASLWHLCIHYKIERSDLVPLRYDEQGELVAVSFNAYSSRHTAIKGEVHG